MSGALDGVLVVVVLSSVLVVTADDVVGGGVVVSAVIVGIIVDALVKAGVAGVVVVLQYSYKLLTHLLQRLHLHVPLIRGINLAYNTEAVEGLKVVVVVVGK